VRSANCWRKAPHGYYPRAPRPSTVLETGWDMRAAQFGQIVQHIDGRGELLAETEVNELMVTRMVHKPADQLRSYELIVAMR
jgi:hypothetical protein